MSKPIGRRRSTLALLAALVTALPIACSDAASSPYTPPPIDTPDGGALDGSSDAIPDAAVDTDSSLPTGPCTTTFRYVPPAGRLVKVAQVTGEWNSFANPGVAMIGPDLDGAFTASLPLSPGLVAYRVILDGAFELDPGARLRKYVGAVENSAVRVADCHLPSLSLTTKSTSRSTAGQGRFAASVVFRAGLGARAIDPATVKVSLRKDQSRTPANANVDVGKQTIAIDVGSLADGKYTVFVDASDRDGHAAKTLRLVFWIEASDFDWRDAVIYMGMTDRFKNGDTANDAPPTAGVDTRADFQGGDLQGVRAAIASGSLDQLGVRAIWLSPFHTNPAGAYPADDGIHNVTGYHGYWPKRAREVDARLGGDAGLKAMVAEAHAHGIRVLQDFVVNHVHKEHEYFTAHPDWFRTGCVCGTNNCDWTAHRLDCLFSDYLPDVNWTVPAASEQFGDDAVWWLDTYDIDGLRIDAVKHVEDAAIVNLTARVRDEFETAGTRVFMTGETAMGWNGDTLAANQDQYDTISRYIGPSGLDGQFDFVLYHGVSYRTFAYDQKGLLHADYWAQASGWEYPQGAIMTPYIGSQDTPRFVTLGSYRGQDAAHDPGIPGNKWSNYAAAPPDAEPYQRHRLALSWLLALPGAPMLYYGDEYGEWGGADPNNRAKWRGDTQLAGEEAATLAFVRKLGTARKELVAMRRGAYRPVYGTDDVLVFARQTAAGEVALVAMTRLAGGATFTAVLPVTLPLAEGTVLRDRLGGPNVRVTGGTVTITLGARGAAILAP